MSEETAEYQVKSKYNTISRSLYCISSLYEM